MNTLPQPDELVFVYGTLKRGGEYEWVMQKAEGEFLGNGRLTTHYPLILDRYPCLLYRPGTGHHVLGEVYRIPKTAGWKYLDWLESYPEEYLRRIEDVRMDHDIVKAWTYFYLRPELLHAGLQPVEKFPV